MTDFFQSGEQPETPVDSQEAPEGEQEAPGTFKVGETEYTAEQIQEMAGLKEKVSEIEKNHGGLENLTSLYGKQANELGQLRKQLEEVQSTKQQQELSRKQQSGEELTPEEQSAQAKQFLDQLGYVNNQNARQVINEVLEARELVKECKSLEEEINGSDGRPAFKSQEVIEFMQKEGARNPMTAYKLMNEESLDKWKESELGKGRKPGLNTLSPTTAGQSKEPKPVKITYDNLAAQMAEALNTPLNI